MSQAAQKHRNVFTQWVSDAPPLTVAAGLANNRKALSYAIYCDHFTAIQFTVCYCVVFGQKAAASNEHSTCSLYCIIYVVHVTDDDGDAQSCRTSLKQKNARSSQTKGCAGTEAASRSGTRISARQVFGVGLGWVECMLAHIRAELWRTEAWVCVWGKRQA